MSLCRLSSRKAKYDSHSAKWDKLFIQEANGLRKLSWKSFCDGFVNHLQENDYSENDIPKPRTVEKFVRRTYNIGLKPPRLDRCSTCWALEAEIKEEKDVEKKNKLETILESHKQDAFMVRDYIYTSFQKSYAQLGKKNMDLKQLEEYID